MMLKRCMATDVQEALENVVRLSTLPWKMFQAHLVHHVEQHRKKKKEAQDVTEELVTTQLGELTKVKK